jgi:hypothetical protein
VCRKHRGISASRCDGLKSEGYYALRRQIVPEVHLCVKPACIPAGFLKVEQLWTFTAKRAKIAKSLLIFLAFLAVFAVQTSCLTLI